MTPPKTCIRCQSTFTLEAIDFAYLKKFDVPEPTHCPACREQRRLVFHNERKLYRTKCHFTGESILSHFSPDKPRVVYKQSVWWGDQWDALRYGRPFDFSRPFFDQFDELQKIVPQVCLFTDYLLDENSEYTNYAGRSKNCYLIAHGDVNRDCYYGYGVKECESCCDIYNTVKCELCYECADCYRCYDLKFSEECFDCSTSAFLKSCVGCKDCFGCCNLHQKQYWIFNTQHTKSSYEAFIKNNGLGSNANVQKHRAEFAKFTLTQPRKNLQMLKTEGCIGDQLVNCKNVTYSYEISDMEDGRYCTQLKLGSKDCMDTHQFGTGAELLYECVICGEKGQKMRFCNACLTCTDTIYCSHCTTSHDLFGCISVRKKEYCILNTQYSREEYFTLLPKIIAHMKSTGEWGEFFPARLSPLGYNETRAIEFFPLTKQQALAQGFNWKDEEVPPPIAKPPPPIPDHISQVDEGISKETLVCEASGKQYRITAPELKLYKQIQVPVPRRSPDQRYIDRMAKKNPRQMWQRRCDQCGVQIMSSYDPKRPELVYCERCYLEAVQ